MGSSESIPEKLPHCWKSHVAAQIRKYLQFYTVYVGLSGPM